MACSYEPRDDISLSIVVFIIPFPVVPLVCNGMPTVEGGLHSPRMLSHLVLISLHPLNYIRNVHCLL